MVALYRKRVGQAVVVVKLLDMCFDVGRIMCRAPAKDKESRKKKWKKSQEEGELTSDNEETKEREASEGGKTKDSLGLFITKRAIMLLLCNFPAKQSH
jgi:hypothetical protein